MISILGTNGHHVGLTNYLNLFRLQRNSNVFHLLVHQVADVIFVLYGWGVSCETRNAVELILKLITREINREKFPHQQEDYYYRANAQYGFEAFHRTPISPEPNLALRGHPQENCCNFADGSIVGFPCRAPHDLDHPFGNLLANIDPEGYPDQVGVLKLNPRTFITIVKQNVKTGLLQCGCNLLGGLRELGIGDIGRSDNHIEWRNAPGK